MSPGHDTPVVIDNIARSFGASYREVDWQDVRQELWLRWFEMESANVERWAAYLPPQVTTILVHWAIDYCEDEVDKLYPNSEDRYYYSRDQIKALLPFVRTPEHWSNLSKTGERGEGRSNNDPANSGDGLATYADLTIGWDSLTDHDRALLTHRYLEPEPTPYEALADLLGVEEAAARKQLSRAVGRMQRRMGGKRLPSPHARYAMTNAHAQSVTSHQWSGE